MFLIVSQFFVVELGNGNLLDAPCKDNFSNMRILGLTVLDNVPKRRHGRGSAYTAGNKHHNRMGEKALKGRMRASVEVVKKNGALRGICWVKRVRETGKLGR